MSASGCCSRCPGRRTHLAAQKSTTRRASFTISLEPVSASRSPSAKGDYAPVPAPPAYSAADIALFASKEANTIKEQICDIGRRIWAREYCDGNGGNISARLGPDRFICTPTGVSKGFMTPDMMCMVDGKGTQLGGTWKRSSEKIGRASCRERV